MQFPLGESNPPGELMKDRNAFRDNVVSRGVPADEAKTLKAYGVPKAPAGGVPAGPRLRGVTLGDIGYIENTTPVQAVVAVKPSCGGKNKLGKDCGAHPVKGEGYCVGHLRSGQSRHSE